MLRTVDAVAQLSNGDRWLESWSFLLLLRDVLVVLHPDDEREVTDAMVMAAVDVDAAVLLKRSRAHWPRGEVLRELTAITPRWDDRGRHRENDPRRQPILWRLEFTPHNGIANPADEVPTGVLAAKLRERLPYIRRMLPTIWLDRLDESVAAAVIDAGLAVAWSTNHCGGCDKSPVDRAMAHIMTERLEHPDAAPWINLCVDGAVSTDPAAVERLDALLLAIGYDPTSR
jgi:hypothetical protein